jgi:hypothetical protein
MRKLVKELKKKQKKNYVLKKLKFKLLIEVFNLLTIDIVLTILSIKKIMG